MDLNSVFSIIILVVLLGAVLAIMVVGRGMASDLSGRVPTPIPCSECPEPDDPNCISLCGMRF